MKKIVFPLIIICGVFVGCYYDKADMVNPNAVLLGCDTTSVSYASTIAPILSNNGCNVCHAGSAAAGGGIELDTYDALKAAGVKGELLPAVRQDPTCSVCASNYAPMPLTGSKLSDCNINEITAWINQGFKQ